MKNCCTTTPEEFRKAGFTLLELLVVLVISSLVGSIVVVRLWGPYRAARFEQVVEQLILTDRQFRHGCLRRSRSADNHFDIDSGVVSADRPGTESPTAILLRLSDARLEMVVTAAGRFDYGKATVSCNRFGQTPTYGLKLRDSRGRSRWIVFLGITGQPMEFEDDKEVFRMFQTLARRTDLN